MRLNKRYTVVVDSNEFHHGKTWRFPSNLIKVQSLLKYGCDYSISGQVGIVGVERKSYADYVRCVGSGWKAFQKQLVKLQRNKVYAVIVEGNIDDPIYEKSLMTHDVVIYRTAIVASKGIPVIFAGSRMKAQTMCLKFLQEGVKRIQDGF